MKTKLYIIPIVAAMAFGMANVAAAEDLYEQYKEYMKNIPYHDYVQKTEDGKCEITREGVISYSNIYKLYYEYQFGWPERMFNDRTQFDFRIGLLRACCEENGSAEGSISITDRSITCQ
ncbi:MAG: hypothetical protein LBH81_00460 [Rickettsiales bacterium]|jgi:hypothetical protein|nr:hypothetical protein [Rickettsiales bacterium]